MAPHNIERRQGALDYVKQIVVLRERWPAAFPAKRHDIRPLELGAARKIAEALGWSVPYALGVLSSWKAGRRYCQAVLCTATRITLDGALAEPVDDEARELARTRLAERAARKAASLVSSPYATPAATAAAVAPATPQPVPALRPGPRDTAATAAPSATPAKAQPLGPQPERLSLAGLKEAHRQRRAAAGA
jgi:sRNA-binding protein